MSAKTKLTRVIITKGMPLSASGVTEALNGIIKALENLEVRETTGDSRLDWSNGYPVLFVHRDP